MKKKKILKVFLLIIATLIVIFAIHFIRNLIIINKISSMQEELSKANNYSYIIESNTGMITEVYYKDGVSKKITKNADAEMIEWFNKNTKEMIAYYPKTMKANVGNNSPITTTVGMQTLNVGSNVIMALVSQISSEEIDGTECYVVKWSGDTTYIVKSCGIILKRIGGIFEQNGIKTEMSAEYKEWKFNELTDEEMEKPDLTGYDISDIVITK